VTVDALTLYENNSFWARDYGRYEPTPPLSESVKVDVAIVGGGFVGLNTAREFKEENPNARLALLEGAVIGDGASGRCAGYNMTQFGLEQMTLKLRWGKERTKQAFQYGIKAVNYTRDLIEGRGLDCDYSHPGLLRVAYSDPQVKTLETLHKDFRELGLEQELGLKWLTRSELSDQFNSPMMSAGLYEVHTGLINPIKQVRELKRLALEAGAEVYEQSPVTLIRQQPDGVLLETPGGTVRADKVLLATNAYTHLLNGLKGIRGRQFPMWTAVVVTERLSEAQWEALGWARREAMEDMRQLIHYFRPTADGRILIGGHDTDAPWGMHRSMDQDHFPDIWHGNEEHLKRLFPSLRDVKIAYRWSGAVSANADSAPEIGFVGSDRIINVTGCFGHGVSLGHLHGRLIADLLADKKTELTDFWIVNRKAIRLPGRLLSFMGTKFVRLALNAIDAWQERRMPG
jgi:glycine/D-amino acid oxidase-like deaminating enzyme